MHVSDKNRLSKMSSSFAPRFEVSNQENLIAKPKHTSNQY